MAAHYLRSYDKLIYNGLLASFKFEGYISVITRRCNSGYKTILKASQF